MPTLVENNIRDGWKTGSWARTLVRKDNGDLLAIIHEDSTWGWAYVSTDEGATWERVTNGGYGDRAYEPGDVPMQGSVHMDSTGRNHTLHTDAVDNDRLYYFRALIEDVSGTQTQTDEVYQEVAYTSSGASHFSPQLALDSTDTVYAGVYEEPSSGSGLSHLKLIRRDGTDNWADLGFMQDTDSTVHTSFASMAMDSNDDVHFAFRSSQSEIRYSSYDTSASELTVTDEEVSSTVTYNGCLAIDSSDRPVLTAGQYVYRRDSGAWETDRFTTRSVTNSTVYIDASDRITVAFISGGDLYVNQGAFGSIDPTQVEAVVDTATTLTAPICRWSTNENNAPATDTLDVIYTDVTDPTAPEVYSEVLELTTLISTVETSQADAGAVPLSGEPTGWLEWGEAADWDDPQEESGVIHPGSTLSLGGSNIAGYHMAHSKVALDSVIEASRSVADASPVAADVKLGEEIDTSPAVGEATGVESSVETGTGVETIEDWEGATPLSNWDGDTGGYSINTSSPITGSASVEGTSTSPSSWRPIATEGVAMEQGHTYRIRFEVPSGVDSDPGIIVGSQHTSGNWPASGLPDSGYMARVNVNEPDIDMWRIDSGAQNSLVSGDPVTELNVDEVYIFEMDWTTSNEIQARVIDTGTDNVLGETPLVSDSTYTGAGVYCALINGSSTGILMDDYEKEPL